MKKWDFTVRTLAFVLSVFGKRFFSSRQRFSRSVSEESRLLIVPALRDQGTMRLANFFDLQRINMEFAGRLLLTA